MKIAIDDTGNGFSTLERIAKLKPDIMKVDMSLVREVEKNRLKRLMIEALRNIAEKAGIQVIAEGVETVEEYNQLRKLGIEYMQGYLFARPSPEPVEKIDFHFPIG